MIAGPSFSVQDSSPDDPAPKPAARSGGVFHIRLTTMSPSTFAASSPRSAAFDRCR